VVVEDEALVVLVVLLVVVVASSPQVGGEGLEAAAQALPSVCNCC
jgi:hypothetical protein